MLARGLAVTLLTLTVVAVASAQQPQRDAPASDQRATGRTMSDGQRSTLVEVVQRLDELRREVAELRGMVEEQGYQIERLKRRQRDQYLDLDRRLQKAQRQGPSASSGGGRQAGVSPGADAQSPTADSGAAGSAASGQSGGATAAGSAAPGQGSGDRQVASAADEGATSGAQTSGSSGSQASAATQTPGSGSIGRSGPGPGVRGAPEAQAQTSGLGGQEPPSGQRIASGSGEDAKAAYDAVFEHLKAGRYAKAAEGFREFLQRHPNGEYADNAQYWLGESYYVTRNYEMALEAFRKLLDRYPDSAKAPDAKLKVGYTHYELENWEKARSTLEAVKQQYPDSTVARLADGRLKVLRLEGH